jgi:hypothetical protein
MSAEAPLTDEQRAIVRECAALFFSQTGSVQECVARVATAAFREGMKHSLGVKGNGDAD